MWLLGFPKLQIFLTTFSHTLKKGRNIRVQRFLRFRNFLHIPRNFMLTKFFKIGYTRNLNLSKLVTWQSLCPKNFNIGRQQNTFSAKFLRKVIYEIFKFSNNVDWITAKVFDCNFLIYNYVSRYICLKNEGSWLKNLPWHFKNYLIKVFILQRTHN